MTPPVRRALELRAVVEEGHVDVWIDGQHLKVDRLAVRPKIAEQTLENPRAEWPFAPQEWEIVLIVERGLGSLIDVRTTPPG